jgi:hypothetical protein
MSLRKNHLGSDFHLRFNTAQLPCGVFRSSKTIRLNYRPCPMTIPSPGGQMPDLFPACIGLIDSLPGRAIVSEDADAADGCGCVNARIGRQGHRQ